MQLTALLLASLVALCHAQQSGEFYITSPVASTTWNANDKVTIQWQKASSPLLANVQSITIDLVNGDPNNANTVMNIASNLQGTATSYQFQVPSNLVSDNGYFLRMQAKDGSGNSAYNYSAKFAIQSNGQAPPSAPSSAPSASKTSTTSTSSPMPARITSSAALAPQLGAMVGGACAIMLLSAWIL